MFTPIIKSLLDKLCLLKKSSAIFLCLLFNLRNGSYFSEETFIISHILHDNNARSAAFGESSFLNIKGHPEVSVKTGTTNDRKDNWTIGYSAYAVVASWVGNNDNSEMSGAVSGVSGASPIWNRIMKEVLDKAEEGFYNSEEKEHVWPEQPANVIGTNVCVDTGIKAGGTPETPDCASRFEYFLKDSIPSTIKGGMQDVGYDKRTQLFIDENTPPEEIETRQQRVIYDPLDTFLCLDCPVLPSSQSARVSYPLVAKPTKNP